MSPNRLVLSCCFLLLTALAFAQKDNPLATLIQNNPEKFKEILANPKKFQVQIIYTQIDRDERNQPHFNTYTYGLDEGTYFYPASTVKMPAAFMALEKLNRLNIIGLDKETPLQIDSSRAPQTAVLGDTSSGNQLASIAHYIKKVFVVSDNDANNRMYEFLGQQAFNEGLWDKGYNNLRIIHRLGGEGAPFGPEDNRYTNSIRFLRNGEVVYQQGEVYSKIDPDLGLRKEVRGNGFEKNGEIINEPFDFRLKNYVSLKSLHEILRAVIFPEATPEYAQFDLSEADYRFLYRVMSLLPKESDYPNYKDKPDDYVKFFMFGNTNEDGTIPKNVRIFNKVGWAYGFLTDASYIVDFDKKIEYFLTATIHVNDNEIYNDGVYEYEEIGLPFFGNIGKLVHDYELKRPRKVVPGLNKFKVSKYY